LELQRHRSTERCTHVKRQAVVADVFLNINFFPYLLRAPSAYVPKKRKKVPELRNNGRKPGMRVRAVTRAVRIVNRIDRAVKIVDLDRHAEQAGQASACGGSC
jgi:hypothetical protein